MVPKLLLIVTQKFVNKNNYRRCHSLIAVLTVFSLDFLFLIRHFSPVRLNALAGIANQRKKCDHYTIKFILNFIVQLYRSGHTDFKLEFLVTCMPVDPTLASHHGKGYQELTATPGMLACQQGGFHIKVSVAISTNFRLIIGLSFLKNLFET